MKINSFDFDLSQINNPAQVKSSNPVSSIPSQNNATTEI